MKPIQRLVRMGLQLASDTTNLSYWTNWKFVLCSLCVLISVSISFFLIWKYENSDFSKTTYKAWTPCVKGIHPVWLLAFRILAFCLLFAASMADVATHGAGLFYYYTQWTFILVTFYFAFGSLMSAYGCCRQHNTGGTPSIDVDFDQEIYLPLTHDETGRGANPRGGGCFLRSAAFWGYMFQIVFQMTAGAVMLTDTVYWIVIAPFLTIINYEMSFLTVVAHSLNLVLLLGDTVLNSLQFPWFRISYFVLLTAFYVIFEWIVHVCSAIWWPYPFLDLSAEYAPMWYFGVAFLHIPCYGMFALIVEAKYYMLSTWFPESYQRLR